MALVVLVSEVKLTQLEGIRRQVMVTSNVESVLTMEKEVPHNVG